MSKKSKKQQQKKAEKKLRRQRRKEKDAKSQHSQPQKEIPRNQPGVSAEEVFQIMRHELLNPTQKFKENKIFAEFSKKLQAMQDASNDELIGVLRGYGVDYQEKKFIEEAKQFDSAYTLYIHWKEKYAIPDCPGLEEAIICEAIRLLSTRLVPNIMNSDQLDDMTQKGYLYLEKGDFVNACLIWLEVWEHLKKRFTPDMKSVNDAERVFNGLQSLLNWCQDLEGELHNAGLDDPAFFQRQILYCREFYTLLPKTDWLIIHNMKRAEAEAYFSLGMKEEGDAAFQSLVEEFPDRAWGYIGWGDMYCGGPVDRKIPVDYDRAEFLYKKALEIADEGDRWDVEDRLKSLEEERKK